MPSYIRLGIRVLYKFRSGKSTLPLFTVLIELAADSRMVRNLLYGLTIKQGRKFSDPASAKSIRPFCKYHNINVDEILEPLETFKNFNEFFYRKLKPGARVLASSDPVRLGDKCGLTLRRTCAQPAQTAD